MAGNNWQQLSGGSTNPYTITRSDTAYTADYSEYVITDGADITLPPPKDGEQVLVNSLTNSAIIFPNGTESVEQNTQISHTGNHPIALTSDGSDWYVANDLGLFLPDSVVIQHDATKVSSTDSITTIPDLVGSFDLSGNASVIDNGINGLQTFRFDGSEAMQQTSTISTQEPFAFVFVAEQKEANESFEYYCDGGSVDEFGMQDGNSAQYRVYRGASWNGTPYKTVDQNPHLFVLETDGVDGIRLERDGEIASENTDSQTDLTGHTLAANGNLDKNLHIDIGQFEVLVNYSSQELTYRKNKLQEKWGTPSFV